MIEILTDHAIELFAIAVAGLGLARFYYGQRFYDIPWQPLRRLFIPLAHSLAKRRLGEEYYASYPTGPEEHVATLDVGHHAVVDDLETAGYVVEPLAALKTNWHGDTEVASYARHRGPKPFPGAPSWLKERQVHVTLFPSRDGEGTIVTAHEEYNSWRPDFAEEHYRGETLNVNLGKILAADDLGLNVEEAPTLHNPVNK